jgi:hypothetical protein
LTPDNLSAFAANGCNRPSNMIGVKGNEFVGEGELGHIPQVCVVPVGEAHGFRQSGNI